VSSRARKEKELLGAQPERKSYQNHFKLTECADTKRSNKGRASLVGTLETSTAILKGSIAVTKSGPVGYRQVQRPITDFNGQSSKRKKNKSQATLNWAGKSRANHFCQGGEGRGEPLRNQTGGTICRNYHGGSYYHEEKGGKAREKNKLLNSKNLGTREEKPFVRGEPN